MENERFFTDAYNALAAEERENYHRTVFLNMDGPFAMAMQVAYYRGRLRSMGQNVFIGVGVKFVNPQYISLGEGVQIHDRCTLVAHTEKGITLDEFARLKHAVYLDTETGAEGYIHIGKRVYVGAGCCLHGHRGLEIGDDSLLAQHVTITPASHKFEDPHRTIYSQGCCERKVVIGRDCYLGMNVCVLHSADVGEGSVVGAGSVVVKPIPPYSVAVGVPACVIRKRGEAGTGRKK